MVRQRTVAPPEWCKPRGHRASDRIPVCHGPIAESWMARLRHGRRQWRIAPDVHTSAAPVHRILRVHRDCGLHPRHRRENHPHLLSLLTFLLNSLMVPAAPARRSHSSQSPRRSWQWLRNAAASLLAGAANVRSARSSSAQMECVNCACSPVKAHLYSSQNRSPRVSEA